jgi:hypothetical protein
MHNRQRPRYGQVHKTMKSSSTEVVFRIHTRHHTQRHYTQASAVARPFRRFRKSMAVNGLHNWAYSKYDQEPY